MKFSPASFVLTGRKAKSNKIAETGQRGRSGNGGNVLADDGKPRHKNHKEIETMMNDATFYRAESMINELYSCDSFSDIDLMLQNVAADTGYSHKFLIDCIYDLINNDGANFWEAIDTVVFTAYEQDY